jgi:hypothetical protein
LTFGKNMKTPQPPDQKILSALIKVFESPEAAAAKCRKHSWAWFAFGLVSVAAAGVLGGLYASAAPFFGGLYIASVAENSLQILAGVLLGRSFSLHARAREIQVLAQYAQLRVQEARDALIAK